MGNWGPGLYQNDITQDVKDDFEESHRAGKPVSEITAKLMADYEDIMGDPAEEPLFWFALADTQWRLGVLLPTVKEKALEWLDKGCACPPIQKIGFSDEAQWNQTLMQLKKEMQPYINEELDSIIIFKSRQEKWLDKEFWAKEDDKTSFML